MTDADSTAADPPAEGDPATALGRSVAERQRPLGARRPPMVGAGASHRPGSLGRRSFEFSLAAGLSLSARRQMGTVAPGLDVEGLPVIPPAEWDDFSLDTVDAPRTGNATLDHIILTQLRTKAASTRRRPTRGLRSAIGRSGTRVGRNTGPGASARRLRPQTAPMSRDLEIQRLVSGDGGDTRPRAPRSGPGGGGGQRRAPGSRPGQETRGRSGRPAPWLDLRGAQGATPAERSPAMSSAASTASAVAGQAGDESQLAGAGGGAIARPAAVAGRPAGGDPAAELTPPSAARGRAAADVSAPQSSRPDVVAGIAAAIPGIGGSDGGASGLHLVRRSAGLPGLPQTPRSSGATVAASAAAAVARMAVASAGVVADAPVGAPGLVRASGGASEVGPSSGLAPVAPPSPGSDSTGRTAGSATTPSGGMTRSSSAPPHGEPALAAALRSDPPALSLASLPRRSFDLATPSAASTNRSSRVSTAPRDGERPRSLSTADLPVAGPFTVASPSSAGSTTSTATAAGRRRNPSTSSNGAESGPARSTRAVAAARDRSADAGQRGLGSVASLLSPVAAGAQLGSARTGERPAEAGRPRALRPLPDLATPSPAATRALAALGVPAELLASLAPPAIASAPVGGSTSTPVQSASSPRSASVGQSAAAPLRSASAAEATTLRQHTSPLAEPAQAVGSSAFASPTSTPAPAQPRTPKQPHTPDLPVAPPATVPADPGERFTHTVEQHGGAKPRPLPQRFEPIARAILPRPDRVRIAVDPASRAALAEAGKVAATAGDVVHLARPLDASPGSLDILAHELTHVAHPSPLVRFFDDDRHSKEEALAREIGQVMAKAPVGSPPAAPPPAPPPVSTGGPAAAPSGGGSGSPPAAPPPPRPGRVGGGSGSRQAGVAAGSPPGLIDPTPDRAGRSGADRTAGTGATLAAAGIDIDRLLDALEARVVRELERRGRRWPRPI